MSAIITTIDQLNRMIDRCTNLCEAMQEISDIANEQNIDEWSDKDFREYEVLQKAIFHGQDCEDNLRKIKRIFLDK